MKKKRIRKVKVKRVLAAAFSFLLFYAGISTYLETYSEFVSAFQAESSGVRNNTVYVNDLDSDYNYFKGLNYTEIRSQNIPSGVSTGYYDDENLVKVKIIYDGKDIISHCSLVGQCGHCWHDDYFCCNIYYAS